MNLTAWTQSPGWIPVVETLLHSLWQATGIAAVLSLAYQRTSNPARRYGLALAALGLTVGLSILTWSIRSASPSTSQRYSKPAESNVQPGLIPPKITSSSHASSTDPAAFSHNAPSELRAAHTSTTSQPHEPATNTHVPWWHPWVVSVWMAGVVVMLFRAGAQIAGADSLRRSAHPIHDPPILELLQHTQRAVGWTRSVTLAITETLTSPAVIGWWSPWILIPGSLFTTLTPEQLRFILLHELAHLKRGDYLTSVAQLILEAVYFFNPAVWWISQQLRNEREACCDRLAVSRCPIPTAEVDYARTLLQVAEWANRRGSAHPIPLPQAALAMAEPSDPNSLSLQPHPSDPHSRVPSPPAIHLASGDAVIHGWGRSASPVGRRRPLDRGRGSHATRTRCPN